MKAIVAFVGLMILVMMLRGYECGVISQKLIAELEKVQNDDTVVNNQEEKLSNLLLRLRREPGPPIAEDSKSQEHPEPLDPRLEHGHHIIDHIMHEIHHGHVTQENINHWMKEIQTALDHGSLEMDDVNHFMTSLKESPSFHGENCCLFG